MVKFSIPHHVGFSTDLRLTYLPVNGQSLETSLSTAYITDPEEPSCRGTSLYKCLDRQLEMCRRRLVNSEVLSIFVLVAWKLTLGGAQDTAQSRYSIVIDSC